MQKSVYLDEQSYECMGELPRKHNASKLIRYFLRAVVLSDADWEAYLQGNEEARKIGKFVGSKTLYRLR